MNEIYRYGSAYPLYPQYAYMLPPEPAIYYAELDRRQASYEEAVIDWDKAYHLDESLARGLFEDRSFYTLPQPVSILEDSGDAFRDNSVSFSRRA